MAWLQGSKDPRRVNEHDRDGNRDSGIGEKRLSSNALLPSFTLVYLGDMG